MVKSAPTVLVLSLHHCSGKDVHIALFSINGVLEPEGGWGNNLCLNNIAQKAWELCKQHRESGKREIESFG